MDFKAIGTALATTIGTVTVGTESVTATALLPNSVSTIALVVFPPEGDLSYLMGGPTLNAHLIYPVRLLRDPLNVPVRTDALLDWATALWNKPMTNYNLDVAGVLEAQATGIHIEINGYEYQPGKVYDVVELTVDVHIYELVTFTP